MIFLQICHMRIWEGLGLACHVLQHIIYYSACSRHGDELVCLEVKV